MPVVAAIKSATGPAYITPSIPIYKGKIIIRGSKNIICLVRERSIPLSGFPIAVKKFDVIGCTKFKNVKNKKILNKLALELLDKETLYEDELSKLIKLLKNL